MAFTSWLHILLSLAWRLCCGVVVKLSPQTVVHGSVSVDSFITSSNSLLGLGWPAVICCYVAVEPGSLGGWTLIEAQVPGVQLLGSVQKSTALIVVGSPHILKVE